MGAIVKDMKVGPADLLAQVGPEMYRAAYGQGQSLSVWLEAQTPSSKYHDGLDAFQRMLHVAGIRTASAHRYGVYADTWQAFHENDQVRALVPEWIARQWRSVQNGQPYSTRALYTSDDAALGTLENAYTDSQRGNWDSQIAPAIPLAQLVAMTTPIDSDTYRAWYLENDASEQRMVRVGEGAEIPRAKLVSSERTIPLYKYGRALEATYEQLRRQRIDKVAMHIQRMAVQAEIDKVATVIDVLVNGDGNTDTAAEAFALTTLDGDASAGTLTLKGWLAFKLKFANPYMLTTALVQEAVALQLLLLSTGTASIPLVSISGASGFGGFEQINPGLSDTVALGWTSDAPASKIVGFDRRFAIERVVEIGSNISEVERYITRQTQVLTMTETEGYAVLDKDAAKVLNVGA